MQFVEQFIAAMKASGDEPLRIADIIADDKIRRYAVAGDTGSKKTGSYKLKIDGDFALGWWCNFRIGETHSWHSKSAKKFTPEEKSAWRKKVETERIAKETERKKLADEAAALAKNIWRSCSPLTAHEYLNKKSLTDAHGAKFYKDTIVIPLFIGTEIRTLQFISKDGDKVFLTDGEKRGGYYALAKKSDDLSRLIITEGYATAATIRECTGLPVVIAFDANNLKPVAEAMHAKYPDAEIIFAADNDRFTCGRKFRPKELPEYTSALWDEWRERGLLYNTGVEKAREAAVSIGGARVLIPVIPPHPTEKRTDWNDLFCLQGKEAVRKYFDNVSEVVPDTETTVEPHTSADLSDTDWESYLSELPPPDDPDTAQTVALYTANDKRHEITNWKEKVHYTDKGGIDGRSLNNCILYLENDPILKNLFCWDAFSNRKMVYQAPPWTDAAKFKPRCVEEDDITYLTAYIEKFGFRFQTNVVNRALDAAIKNNPRNPAQEYFNSLQWDEVPRLDNWLHDYCGCNVEDERYLQAVGRKWLCASVARVFTPGEKFDHMLVLEGPQNIGKSTVFRELATIHGQSYFDDTIKLRELGTVAAVAKFQGRLIVEIQELAGIEKKSVDELKGEITQPVDNVQLKYQNHSTDFPRKFIFGGTHNPIQGNGYLTDPTGNRRFWPVSCTRIDIKGLRRDKEQIWAEAVMRVKAGEELFLNPSETAMAMEVTQQRMSQHPWTQDLASATALVNIVTKDELWEKLNIHDRTKRTHESEGNINKIMSQLGFSFKQKRFGEERRYVWVRNGGDE